MPNTETAVDVELTEDDLDPAVIQLTLEQYLITALWSSTDENGEPLDGGYGYDDLSAEAVAQARTDVVSFLISNADLIAAAKAAQPAYDDGAVAHDFWLTRNGHGAGFWDRGLGQVGDELTANVRPYGSADLYVGDDGRVHLQ